MSDSAGWWANRIGQQRGAPQAYQPPPQQPPQYPYPGQHQQPQQQQVQQPPQILSDEAFIAAGRTQGNEHGVTPMDVLERAGAKGGKGTRTETSTCPECGGNQFFQRKALAKMGHAPAPYCHSCGYNGMFEQYGAQDIPLTMEEG